MITLDSIVSGKVERPRRYLLTGLPKAGKSETASQSEAPIFLPIIKEEGIDDLDVKSFPVIASWAQLEESIAALFLADSIPYKTVVIDSVSTLERLIHAEVCKASGDTAISDVGGGYGRGTDRALGWWDNLTTWMDQLRAKHQVEIVMIGHVKKDSFDDPTAVSYDRWILNIDKKAAAHLEQWADCTLFQAPALHVSQTDAGFGKKVGKATEGGVCLYTRNEPSHPGGGRGVYGRLPEKLFLPLGENWQTFKNAVAKATAEEKGSDSE